MKYLLCVIFLTHLIACQSYANETVSLKMINEIEFKQLSAQIEAIIKGDIANDYRTDYRSVPRNMNKPLSGNSAIEKAN